MSFYADLHVHSRYSRATSRDATLEQFALWARKKGLSVVGTGDFTHPAWFKEIRENLVPEEPGLFRLRPDLEDAVERRVPPACRRESGPVRFILEVEISTIYKKGDQTRKVHHIVFAPHLEMAALFIEKLSRIGNLLSDGRPILGLDSRNLLEIALESGDGCFLIPAHIWTPWFSALGSKSGFDAIDDCYGDLAPQVFALETGLSSDPPMNWRLSQLDRFRLVSNSDAHSPPKLGREACVFDTALDYFAMRDALATGRGYGGTVEFFPEEGKYHLDGHRKCGVRLSAAETRRHKGLCPECGKPLTVGVMNRVEELADRAEGARPEGAAPFRSLIPLPEVLGEILGAGPDSKRVTESWEALMARVGPELYILAHAPIPEIERAGAARLAEAIARMREGRVIREAGYDGEYGVIRVFAPEELAKNKGSAVLFELPAQDQAASTTPDVGAPPRRREGNGDSRHPFDCAQDRRGGAPTSSDAAESSSDEIPAGTATALVREPAVPYPAPDLFGMLGPLDPDQRAAAEIADGPLLIIAGPGTGKTRTLTHRIAHLITARGALPEQCLAITFTHRAAEEMIGRLRALLPGEAERVPVMTFHSLGYRMLREHSEHAGLPDGFRVAAEPERLEILKQALAVGERQAHRALQEMSSRGRAGEHPEPGSDAARSADAYRRRMRADGLVDFDDLIRLPVELLTGRPDLAAEYRARYRWVSVDEYQDIDEAQYRLIRLLVPPDGNLCAIGDPDQAIYGFRGTDVRFFQRFAEDFPGARTVALKRNYRSGRSIVDASLQVIAPASLVAGRTLEALAADPTRIVIHEAATDRSEAEFVVHTVEQTIGGSTFFSMDSGRVEAGETEALSFADFAVLYRTDAQAAALAESLARSGMPFQKRSHVRLGESPAAQAIAAAMGTMTAEPDLARRLDRAAGELREEEQRREAALLTPALRGLAQRCHDMQEFLSQLALSADVDLWDPRADAISLLTLHASKGLEFPVVFIVGCEDGLVPLRWDWAGRENDDEERRLFFVGMTRARRRLFLTYARKRLWMGTVRERIPSPFLRDIEEQLLERRRTEARRKAPKAEQLDLFG